MVHIEGPNADRIAKIISSYPAHLVDLCTVQGIRVHALRKAERYLELSGTLSRLQLDVDNWPAPPAGLFVVDERTIYLRTPNTMTVAHEFGHALDCALGSGIYHSFLSPQVRAMYRAACNFVTPYAATGLDEYFAEGCRAMVEANGPNSYWPKATRRRLEALDPPFFKYLTQVFTAPVLAQALT